MKKKGKFGPKVLTSLYNKETLKTAHMNVHCESSMEEMDCGVLHSELLEQLRK